jgi:hypothetical protein
VQRDLRDRLLRQTGCSQRLAMIELGVNAAARMPPQMTFITFIKCASAIDIEMRIP